MPVNFVCDACGNSRQGEHTIYDTWQKPRGWAERGHKNTVQIACSEKCKGIVQRMTDALEKGRD